MNRLTTVFILGAGCSHKYGYPLGASLADQLQEFRAKIPKGCDIIHQAVGDTVALAADLQVKTLDELAKRFEDEFSASYDGTGGIPYAALKKKEGRYAKPILDAKIATAALFLDREDEARKTSLHGYRRLIASMFDGSPWRKGVESSNCHVLSFNYDRLFEIVFLDRFKEFDPKQFDLYGEYALNSGFGDRRASGSERIEPAAGRFCFLKLHGSAGWCVKRAEGNPYLECRRYCPAAPATRITLQDIEKHLRKQKPEIYPWEPLIAFPHEKKSDTDNHPGDFLRTPYITKIWKHAASILKDAKQVRVIGYSFNPIDSRDMVDKLLSKATACDKIVIQNPDEAGVRAALKSCEGKLRPLEFDKTEF
jgi:hypothetical protein